jgi:hypothetical protein
MGSAAAGGTSGASLHVMYERGSLTLFRVRNVPIRAHWTLLLILPYLAVVLWRMPPRQLHTAMFVLLVFTGLATVFVVRERRAFWRSLPGRWVLVAIVADVVVVSLMANRGILMAAIPATAIAAILSAVVAFLFVVDAVKLAVLSRWHRSR